MDDVEIVIHPFNWGLVEAERVRASSSRSAVRAIRNIKASSTNTNYGMTLPRLANLVGPSGSGTPNDPKKVVIMFSDGIEQTTALVGDYQPIDPAGCQPFKDQGVEFFVLNLKYPNPTRISTNSAHWDGQKVAQFINQVPGKLRDCATPDRYFEAEFGNSVTRALNRIKRELLDMEVFYLSG